MKCNLVNGVFVRETLNRNVKGKSERDSSRFDP